MDIIKKIAAIILVAALCLGGAALAEETPEVTPGDFLDEWVDLDGTCGRHLQNRDCGAYG